MQSVAIVISVAVYQEYKSDQSLEALSKLAPPNCRVLRDGVTVEVDAASLVPGDIVLLAVGDRIPADLRLLVSVDLAIDESSLTGENEPCSKTSNPVTHTKQHSDSDEAASAPVSESVADILISRSDASMNTPQPSSSSAAAAATPQAATL